MVAIPEFPVTILDNGDRLHLSIDSVIFHSPKKGDVVPCNNKGCKGTILVTPRDIKFYIKERGVPLECDLCGGISTIMNKGIGVWIPPRYVYEQEYLD